MFSKKTTALLGSILLLVAAMPLATAHLSQTGSWSSGHHTQDQDYCRWEGRGANYVVDPIVAPAVDFANGNFDAGCVGSPGVSGSYNNLVSPNLFLASTAVDPTSGDPFFPDGYVAAGLALCDLEVLGAGTTHDLADEERVDNDSPAGSVPDGTFDDGGFGGACHTLDQYEDNAYNTPGCGENIHFSHAGPSPHNPQTVVAITVTPFAHAEDYVSGGLVWIGPSCDYQETQGSGFTLEGCVVNEIISGASPAKITACITTFINGAPAPFLACGADSIADATNYGIGGGNGGPGIPYPPVPLPCTQFDASSAVFTFDYVNADTLAYTPATFGWIDSR